jgi:hypothetical protein
MQKLAYTYCNICSIETIFYVTSTTDRKINLSKTMNTKIHLKTHNKTHSREIHNTFDESVVSLITDLLLKSSREHAMHRKEMVGGKEGEDPAAAGTGAWPKQARKLGCSGIALTCNGGSPGVV